MLPKLRKHRTALIALAVYHFVVFFPTLFMGRVLSPNDVFYNFDPWALTAPVDVQNPLIHDPPTSYLTLVSLLKHEPGAFHWNPYIASGIPGFGSSAAAVLSPFILLPALAVPLVWVYAAIVFLKLNVAFWFAYLWLREERLGKGAAAIGAIVVAGAGVYAVRWLWQITNATPLYPALLWLTLRAFREKRNSIAAMALLALAYALAGFPSSMAYGAYLIVAYAIFLAIRERRLPVERIAAAVTAVIIALAIAAPSLVPFVQLVRRTGYLALRERAALQNSFPRTHWASFLDPERLGNPAFKNWKGDPALGMLNNYFEATVYVGLAAIALTVLAIGSRRARRRFFWILATAVILACMFGMPPIAPIVAQLPGFKYSSLARVVLLLPVAAGYLSAAGAALLLRKRRWRPWIAATLAALAAWDLALVAARFYPFLEPRHAVIPETPTISFLRKQEGPFRIAPMFNYFWPNASELFRLEDIRSHFSSEAEYRAMLQRIDPTSFGSSGTVISFDSRSFAFDDPLVGMLGVRYFVEHKNIDIVKWKTLEKTVPAVKERGVLALKPREVVERTIPIDVNPFWAIELPVSGTTRVQLLRGGNVVYSRDVPAAEAAVMEKIYLPLLPYARDGAVTLRVQALAPKATLLRGDAPPGEAPIYYARVMTPVVFERLLPDGKLFRNLAEVPRFHAVSRVRRGDVLAIRDIDFAEEAIVDADVQPGGVARLTRYTPSEQRIAFTGPGFLASSEKLTPELRITIDGNEARPVRINGIFAGVQVPAGEHEVVYQRRIGRDWLWLAMLAVITWSSIAGFELSEAWRPR